MTAHCCFVCGGPRTVRGDFGPHPVANRYAAASREAPYRNTIALAQCDVCGLLQLQEAWPADEVRPRLPWIAYNEPERHLDDFADSLSELPDLAKDALVAGLSYKDAPVLERLKARGFTNLWCLDQRADLGIASEGAGMESIQERLVPSMVPRLVARRRRPALVIARHLIEHAADARKVVTTLRNWLVPGGYLAIEVPDSERGLTQFDYTLLWEEHVLYFTERTLARAIPALGLRPVELQRHAYAMEDCFVAITRNLPPDETATSPGGVEVQEQAAAVAFASGVSHATEAWRNYLERYRRDSGRGIAVFGAGHRATMFINLFGLGPLLDCVIDDDPHKAGLFMPGSGVAIVPSTELRTRNLGLCLMTLSPESESRVQSRHAAFTGDGGHLLSIYPGSDRAAPAAIALRTTS